MEDQYVLEKWEWTEKDFESMGWHDCPVYALRFDDNIYLDLDYIFKWNDNGPGNSFTFWISPATLIFEKAHYLKMDIESDFINGFEIADISKFRNEKGATIWNIATQEGEILIGAESFRQIIRRPPSFQINQSIIDDERGEISFSIISEKNYQPSADVIKRKNSELELYELGRKRTILLNEKDELDKNELGTKEYLLKKHKIEQNIRDIDQLNKESSTR
ncbi:MAG TPA: hypothetical protein VK668_19210 [Mucilaginibacter sp.]|nr:hypothetical protein [Mucilaginibacter sp.]